MRIDRLLLPGLMLGLVALGQADAQIISMVSGNGQIACQVCFSAVPKSTFDPLVVKVLDATGRPLANATVTWAITNSTGQAGSLSYNTTTTDATGQTSVQFFSNYNFINVFGTPFQQSTITASIGASSVQFIETQALTVQNQPTATPINVQIIPGQQISGSAGQTSPTPFVVTVVAANGTPVAGVAVQLGTDDVAGGPTVACQSSPGQAPGVVLTDTTGTASCTLVFGPVVGVGATFKVITGGGYSTSAPLNFNVTVGPPGLITVLRGDQQTATLPGTNLPAPLVAKVSDLGGNPTPGGTVTWSVIPTTAATPFNQQNTSAVDGQVSTGLTIGAAAGPFQVRVALVSNPAAFATFTVNAPQVVISGLTKNSGDGQTAAPNTAFSAPLAVQAVTSGQPAAGVAVAFTVTSGSATPASGAATTNAQGVASFNLAAGPTLGPVTVVASAGGQSVTFNLSVATGPAFTSNSFYNGASFVQGSVSPCSVATIIASGLAPGIQGVVTPGQVFGPLPYLLAGVAVTIGGRQAPLFNVANVNGQQSITIQVPCEITQGQNSVTITVNGTPQTANVTLLNASPGIFETGMSDGKARAVLVRSDGSFVDATTNPARRGELIRLYSTGLGQTSALVTTNSVPIPTTDVTIAGSVIVGVANSGVRVVSARLAPDLIGVAEVVFEVPADAPTGSNIVLSVAVNPSDGSSTQFSKGSLIPIL